MRPEKTEKHSAMEKKPKTYKEEILPLWLEEIKLALGLTNPMNALLRTGDLIAGIWFTFYIPGSLENFFGSLVYELGKFVFLVSVILILFFCTYVRVSN